MDGLRERVSPSPLEAYENGDVREALLRSTSHGISDAERLKLRAVLLLERREFTEARLILNSLALDAQVYKMLGYCAFMQDCFEDASWYYKQSLELDSGYLSALHDLGISESLCGRDGKPFLERALRVSPGWAQSRMDLGILKLNEGDESGWADYEARFEDRGERFSFQEPRWNGEDISGKRFLLLMEQGYGDQLQFLRGAKWLADRGAWVCVAVHEKLKRLACLQSGVREVYLHGHPAPPFDFWLQSMSLPRVVGGIGKLGKPSLNVGGIRGDRVGLCWKGNPEHKNDRFRSIPFGLLKPLTDEFECVRVQFDLTPGEPGTELPDLTVHCADFLDTAMQMLEHLDCLVTCDTAIAHLAGSLGLPTVFLMPVNPDFRWRIQAPEAYYPSWVTVPNTGNWDAAIAVAASVIRGWRGH